MNYLSQMILELNFKFSGTIAMRRPLKASCARFIVLKVVELSFESRWLGRKFEEGLCRRKDFTGSSDSETETCIQKLVGVNFRK
jgi:hypothetical protein